MSPKILMNFSFNGKGRDSLGGFLKGRRCIRGGKSAIFTYDEGPASSPVTVENKIRIRNDHAAAKPPL